MRKLLFNEWVFYALIIASFFVFDHYTGMFSAMNDIRYKYIHVDPKAGKEIPQEKPKEVLEEGATEHHVSKKLLNALIKGLSREDVKNRKFSAIKLGNMGSDAMGAAHPLTIMLHDKLEENRYQAAIALGKIGFFPKKILPPLIEALESEDHYHRKVAIETLGKMGDRAEYVVPYLVDILKNDPTKSIQDATLTALENIGTQEALKAIQTANYEERLKND